MAAILIGYDTDAGDARHFFETCADAARDYAVKTDTRYDFLTPPHLTSDKVIEKMSSRQMFFVAAHGDADGVYIGDDQIVGTRTVNHVFEGKCFYTVACNCAKNLKGKLIDSGLKIFVGYCGEILWLGKDEEIFCNRALEGLNCILQGMTAEKARESMYRKYDEAIESATFLDRGFLISNRENLVFEFTDTNLTIKDLK